MTRYQTEIIVPPDRYVCLQLPAYLPEGQAVITVQVREPDRAEPNGLTDADPDRQDIEWWEEFEDDGRPLRDCPFEI